MRARSSFRSCFVPNQTNAAAIDALENIRISIKIEKGGMRMRNDEIAVASATVIGGLSFSDGGTPSNIRAILRAGNDYFLRTIDRLATMHGDDLISALIFNAIWTANVKHITYSDANSEYGGMNDIPPDSLRRPVSVLALSGSLRIPYETVRRYVRALHEQGLCVRVDGKGVMVPAEVFNRPMFRQAILQEIPSFLRFLEDLKRSEFDFAPYRRRLANTVTLPANGDPPSNLRAILRISMELIMRAVDALGKVHGDDFLRGFVFTAIWTANVRHITAGDGNLKFGGLDELPPDEMRRPVSIAALAGSLRIPYETVRRHAASLIREGIAIRADGKGVIIPRAQLDRPAMFEAIRTSHTHIARTVADLHRAGFDFSGY